MNKNILLITADDLNYNSVGCFGCRVHNITPHLDCLASEGVCFDRAHVTIAVCQPSRQSMLTGLYPHHNGAPGFNPIRDDVPTLTQILREHGYYNGIIGKVEHCQPEEKFCWDFCDDVYNFKNLHGRSPYIYYRDSTEFFNRVKENGKPFFFMVNSHDPHRPFAGSEDELKIFYGYNTYASRYYKPEEIEVPGFLPDIDGVRKELAQYFSSVHRLDETVGNVLKALDEAGFADSTLVVFMSDNGMAFPFAKANCYLNSTKTPLIVRWPGVIEGGARNTEDYIAGIDFTPTILEYAGLKDAIPCDGKSYLPILKGEKQTGRDVVFTQFNLTSMNRSYPMRCVQSKDFGYIFNAWSDGKTLYTSESKTGLTYKAMRNALDKRITDRADFYDYRCKEEFYDFKKDPDGLNNLIDNPEYAEHIEEYKRKLLDYMIDTSDPVLEAFQKENKRM